MKRIQLNSISLTIFLSAGLLSACGGGGDTPSADAPPPSTSTTAADAPSPSASTTTAAAPAPSTSTTTTASPTPVKSYEGAYSGRVGWVYNASTYGGPMNMVLTQNGTGNYTVSGSWNVQRNNSSGPQSTTNDIISGTVNSAGVLTASGNVNIRSITGTVDLATSKITGSYTYDGASGTFTGTFSLAK